MTTKEFNEVFINCREEIFNYINWKINNFHNAEDLTVEVFTKAHRLIYTNDLRYRFDSDRSNIKTWLRTIANCAIIDFYRTNKRRNSQCVSDIVNSETGEEIFQFFASRKENSDFNIENLELKNRINKAFATLKPKYKRIAILYFLNDRDYKGIAEICDVPLNTVKVMIMRIREKLQVELKDLYIVKSKIMV